MKQTTLLYLNDTYVFAGLCQIQELGSDEKGQFLIPDQTIFYPGGGGQPMDRATFESNGRQWKIIGADFNGGFIKHYFEGNLEGLKNNNTVAIRICSQSRKLHAMYHTGGHWIASAINENLQLPLFPNKGYHYPEGAYVEFEGDRAIVNDSILEDLHYAINIDRQADLQIKAEIISPADKDKLSKAFIPSNFQPHPEKPLRLVRMENYRSVPCGGTHLQSIREIKSIKATKIFVKNGKIRISYGCVPWEMPVS